MAQPLTQDTLNKLGEILEVEPVLVSLMQSLNQRAFTAAQGWQDEALRLDNYARTASNALWGAAAQEDRLLNRIQELEQGIEDLYGELRISDETGIKALEERNRIREVVGMLDNEIDGDNQRISELIGERDQARKIAGQLLALLRMADDAVYDPTPVKMNFDYLAGTRDRYSRALHSGRLHRAVRP